MVKWACDRQCPTQIYLSLSTNPFVNLAFEDFLFKKTPNISLVLFLYRNNPAVIIGRNQNPWREANMHAMASAAVNLVRRRSGGGAVYHDLGNLCWSVIMPRKAFDKYSHSKMVIGAIGTTVDCIVNSRNDIVKLDAGGEIKFSGSAYKIVKERAYHHATLLLSSNLQNLSRFLREESSDSDIDNSLGVESIRSRVGNLNMNFSDVSNNIISQFILKYRPSEYVSVNLTEQEILEINEVQTIAAELQSWEWIYGSTPQFESTWSFNDMKITMTSLKGKISRIESSDATMFSGQNNLNTALVGCRLGCEKDITSRFNEALRTPQNLCLINWLTSNRFRICHPAIK